MWRILERTAKGEATHKDIDLLTDVTKQIEGHTICAFGDAAAWPVQSYITKFRDEFEEYIRSSRSAMKQETIPCLD